MTFVVIWRYIDKLNWIELNGASSENITSDVQSLYCLQKFSLLLMFFLEKWPLCCSFRHYEKKKKSESLCLTVCAEALPPTSFDSCASSVHLATWFHSWLLMTIQIWALDGHSWMSWSPLHRSWTSLLKIFNDTVHSSFGARPFLCKVMMDPQDITAKKAGDDYKTIAKCFKLDGFLCF